jgi:hypothetical protein
MALLDQLTSHWSLEEASGTRADDLGGNTLTDGNTVTQATGKVGQAAQFTAANTESLTRTDNAALSTGDINFAVAAWVYADTLAASATFVSRETSGTVREYRLEYDQPSSRFRFLTFNAAGSAVGLVSATTFGAPSAATWYFVYAERNKVAGTVGISVNAGTLDTAVETGVPADTASTFAIGARLSGAAYWNGRIDQVGFWKRVLTSQDRTDLYNGGNGLAFSGFSGTYTLSGSATTGAATGSGAGLLFFMPTSMLSGSATPANATGSGVGLVNTNPVFTLSGTAPPTSATGSGVGLVNTNPVSSLSGSATAQAATGSGIGLLFSERPGNIVALTLASRSRALTPGDRA